MNKKNECYDKIWIEELSNNFYANVIIDKSKNIKPLYGGGTYTMLGYYVTLKTPPNNITSFILEGLQINGIFVNVSIILFIKNQIPIMHGTLKLNVEYAQTEKNNIKTVIELINNKINEYTK